MDGLMHVPKGRPSNSTTGLGWRMYAAAMLTLSASVNVVWGIIALWSNYYWGGDSAASGQPELWGWLFIVIAVVQLSIVGLILIGSGLGLLLGIGVAGTNAILHLHLVDSHPGWAVVAIGADLLVIYALARPWFRPG